MDGWMDGWMEGWMDGKRGSQNKKKGGGLIDREGEGLFSLVYMNELTLFFLYKPTQPVRYEFALHIFCVYECVFVRSR